MSRQSRSLALAGAVLLAVVVAFAAGRSSRRPAAPGGAAPVAAVSQPRGKTYTCSMHPQVRLPEPGKCPICRMPLVPADAGSAAGGGEPMLRLSDHARAMASVETTPVTRRALARELRAVGKVQYNESSLATVTARVDGYAERLFVNFTGVEIKKGDHLADVYSPDLLVAQQELLIALQGGGGRDSPLVETAALKLERWGLTPEQVEALVGQKKITDRVTLLSPIAGTVIEKTVVENSAFKAGDVLYRVANLDTVWVYLDVYEYDLAWLRYGQRVDVTAEALPGRTFPGVVTFIQPLVTEETRTVRVPVHVENPDHTLKPGMFASAVVKAPLSAAGEAAPTGVEGKFTCPMHPQVLRDEAGNCPVCDMPLERIPGGPTTPTSSPTPTSRPAGHPDGPDQAAGHDPAGHGQAGGRGEAGDRGQPDDAAPLPLAVPATAVLDSGTRRIAYVEKSPGLFEPREVTIGPRSGAFVAVLKGLKEGERVVTRGGFLIDSQFQITGSPSLFYPGGLAAGPGAGHQHGGAGTGAGAGGGAAGHKH